MLHRTFNTTDDTVCTCIVYVCVCVYMLLWLEALVEVFFMKSTVMEVPSAKCLLEQRRLSKVGFSAIHYYTNIACLFPCRVWFPWILHGIYTSHVHVSVHACLWAPHAVCPRWQQTALGMRVMHCTISSDSLCVIIIQYLQLTEHLSTQQYTQAPMIHTWVFL